jgi:serine/threonine protein kinase
MPFTKIPNAEPIPGYRLIAPLGCGGFGEVWKCQAPGGIFKAIKFVYGNLDSLDATATPAQAEMTAIQHVKDVRHPFLLSIDRIECVAGELMIVTELADKNLHEVMIAFQHQGEQGMPRRELLHFLSEAAEVLDLMNMQHGLLHLDVKPRNFFLVGNHVKVADFGLVTSLAGAGTAVMGGAVTPLYASPEVFVGKPSSTSDQYSLACCYVELLTGKPPFHGQNGRQLWLQHTTFEPDLSRLPEIERPILAKALAKDPPQRHPSCVQFIRAVQGERRRNRATDNTGESAGHIPGNPTSTSGTVASESLAQTPTSERQTVPDWRSNAKGQASSPRPVAGYELLENQGSNLLADLWKAKSPDGRVRQVKVIYGFAGQVDEALSKLLALRHPALPEIEVAQNDPGFLVLVHECITHTVRDRFQECRAKKLPGIPRTELLDYLRTTAEVVDFVQENHGIHHLGLNPKQLVLTDTGLQVADFGSAHLFWLPAGQPIAERNARYAAPELFSREIHRNSDQFSVAIMYQELLTGVHPFAGMSPVASASVRAKASPNLEVLQSADRKAIAKALDPDPELRWSSCVELVRELQGANGTESSPIGEVHGALDLVPA